MMGAQFQRPLDETDYLDSFQSGFRLGDSNETLLASFVNELWRVRQLMYLSWHLSVVFDIINHGILLDQLWSLGVRVMSWGHCFAVFFSFLVTDSRWCWCSWGVGIELCPRNVECFRFCPSSLIATWNYWERSYHGTGMLFAGLLFLRISPPLSLG